MHVGILFSAGNANFHAKTWSEAMTESEEVVVQDLDEVEELIEFTYAITAYGADYPVDSLVKRMKSHDILVPSFDREPDLESDIVGFQREYVWTRTKADRFIESLLLGLPVPGIFLVKEASGRLLVLDGHQRLHTLQAYYEGVISGREYRLANVQKRFVDRRYADLDVEDRRRLDDSIIHATIVRQDEPSDDQSSVYMIFERLNTGGASLQPQEIRVALYHGQLVTVLTGLNKNDDWRKLYGGRSKRLKDMELILRFFAFFFFADNYRPPMKDFLNRYMAGNRQLDRQPAERLRKVFEGTIGLISKAIGVAAFRPKRAVNAAVVDSLMVGVARRLDAGPVIDMEGFKRQWEQLMRDDEYASATETGTSQERNVVTSAARHKF